MHAQLSTVLGATVALFAASAAAQCQDMPVTGDAAFVAEGWNGLKTQSTGNSQWTLTTDPAAADPSKGYIAVHFNPQKCRDLSQYKGVAFDLVAPQNGKFAISWAVRQADCQTKAAAQPDYADAAKYVSNGKVLVPFADFAKLDTKYVEDMTLISFNPVPTNAGEWKISNIVLKCDLTSTTGGAANGTNTPSTSRPSSVPQPSGTTAATTGSRSGSGASTLAGAASVGSLLAGAGAIVSWFAL